MNNIKLQGKNFTKFISAQSLGEVVERVANDIQRDLASGEIPLFLVTLNGAFMFASDVLKRIKSQCQVSFIKLSSYAGTESTGSVKELIGLNEELTGKKIIIIEDIIETGTTMATMLDRLREHGAKDVKIATLMFKPQRLKTEISPDYVGMNIGDEFIVGYGLDYNGLGRNLPDIYVQEDLETKRKQP